MRCNKGGFGCYGWDRTCKIGGKMLKLATLYDLSSVEFNIFAFVIENLKTLSNLVLIIAQFWGFEVP
jgi:hypothetical protein